ncbi:MAG: CxxxxCH/CxxCH domain-containing protein [Labilithrix sp.]|nr:CxxxxCH/CxxCH domain-containing protein [Labilithrix sp.]
MRRSFALASAVVVAALFACETSDDDGVVAYRGGAQPILEARCVRCHADSAPAGGFSASSYLGAVGCTASGAPALAAALDRADHAQHLSAEERAVLVAWLAAGSPRSVASLHGAGFADPRSPSSHGRMLRASGYAPITDASHPDACGTCHDGAVRREGIAFGAPDAPSCTSCHAQPGGVLACSTCHGHNDKAYPPRNPCFFPSDRADRTHAAHVEASASRARGLACAACHPTPGAGDFSGVHANGYTDVAFDYTIAGREAKHDATSGRCAGTCHDRGGARPAPAWGETAMTCNDCHASPPADHYRGACTSCHREANATGTALIAPALHADGKVDLGDGSGRCGACHGRGDDPWPDTGAHRAHAAPASALQVACETCHDAPGAGEAHPRGTGTPAIRLAGLATRGGRRASYDPVTKTCSGTYCHEGSGAALAAPRWTDGADARACNSCHGAPPPPPHAQSATCGGAACHEGRTTGLAMTAAGRLSHVDGVIDRGPP